MTLEEFYKATENMPKDIELWTYTGGIYRKVVDTIKLQEVWVDGTKKKILEIQGCNTL